MTMLFEDAPERVRTTSFVIRAWSVDDGRPLYEAIDQSRDHLQGMPWARAYTDESHAHHYVRRSRATYLLHQNFALGIWTPDEREVLGGTGFHLRGTSMVPAKTAEIGMWIRAQRAGQGLGSAVLRELLRWGFDQWGWMRLEWRCNEDNVASRRCAEKAGMLREGTMRGEYDEATQGQRDTAHYGLCRADYRAGSG